MESLYYRRDRNICIALLSLIIVLSAVKVHCELPLVSWGEAKAQGFILRDESPKVTQPSPVTRIWVTPDGRRISVTEFDWNLRTHEEISEEMRRAAGNIRIQVCCDPGWSYRNNKDHFMIIMDELYKDMYLNDMTNSEVRGALIMGLLVLEHRFWWVWEGGVDNRPGIMMEYRKLVSEWIATRREL